MADSLICVLPIITHCLLFHGRHSLISRMRRRPALVLNDVTVGWVGSDRIVSDGTTEIPDVSIAVVPRIAGEPGKDTLMAALEGGRDTRFFQQPVSDGARREDS